MTTADTRPPAPAQRDRSPSFPFIPLKTAIERLVAFEDHHKRSPVPADRVGPAWGMKPNSSQAQQTLAALKAYGLLESWRSDGGRVVVVSEDGRMYLRAQQDSIKSDVLRRAALRPKQIEAHWRDWGADRPANAACLDALVLNANFSEDGAETFLRVYDATIAYARLTDSDKSGADGKEDAPAEPDDEDGEIIAPPSPISAGAPRAKAGVPIMTGERVVFTEEGQPNQYLKVIASGDVDDGLLEALEDFVKRQRKRLEFLNRPAGVAPRPLPGIEPPPPDPVDKD